MILNEYLLTIITMLIWRRNGMDVPNKCYIQYITLSESAEEKQ
jgi:hypothetical protein